MSELIAASLECSTQDAYIAGLLSALDSVFNEPLPRLVEPLPIDVRFKRALLEREGALGAVLDCVLAYEAGAWSPGKGPDAEQMERAFWDSAEYARDMMSQMATAASQ
jgi:EAL and modified HD-GYP domain-containing signal transduction protein